MASGLAPPNEANWLAVVWAIVGLLFVALLVVVEGMILGESR